jgi:hypothetical protein
MTQFVLDKTRLPELAGDYPVSDDRSALLALETAILGNGEHSSPLITGPCDLGVDLLANGDGEIDGYRIVIHPSADDDEPYISSQIQRVSYFTPLAEPTEDGDLYDTAEIVLSAVMTANELLAWAQLPRPRD